MGLNKNVSNIFHHFSFLIWLLENLKNRCVLYYAFMERYWSLACYIKEFYIHRLNCDSKLLFKYIITKNTQDFFSLFSQQYSILVVGFEFVFEIKPKPVSGTMHGRHRMDGKRYNDSSISDAVTKERRWCY